MAVTYALARSAPGLVIPLSILVTGQRLIIQGKGLESGHSVGAGNAERIER